jgi:hypothetical protein
MSGGKRTKKSSRSKGALEPARDLKIYLVPCSCGTTFAVSPKYDRGGTTISRYIPCPKCGKRHDPKNRLLQLGYQKEKYWKVDQC